MGRTTPSTSRATPPPTCSRSRSRSPAVLQAAGRVGAIADAAGIGLYGGTMLEAGVGTIASAHLFATFPQLAWGTELFGPLLLTEEILTEPLGYGDFALKVPDRPGLGVELDPDRIDFFRRDRAGTRTHSFPANTQA